MNFLNASKKAVAAFAADEAGAQVVEYGMIIGAVSIALIVALRAIDPTSFASLVTKIGDCLTGGSSCA